LKNHPPSPLERDRVRPHSVNEEKPAGEYEVELNAANLLPKGSLTSGIYFYQLVAGQYSETKKMILLK